MITASTIIVNGQLVLPDRVVGDGGVAMSGSTIVAVGTTQELTALARNTPSANVIDADKLFICPGFIDVHVHGGGGADTMDGTTTALLRVIDAHTRHGTTTLCPTTLAATNEELCVALAALASVRRGKQPGHAEVLGAHIEGPFINRVKHGAHLPDKIAPASRDILDQFLAAADGAIAIVTIAPETPGAIDLIQYAVSRDIKVSLGHTNASYTEMQEGFAAGATHITHLFNAMTKFDHRAPGAVVAAFNAKGIYAELITDGCHVSPEVVNLAIHTMGTHRIMPITDALRAAAHPSSSRFLLGGRSVHIEHGACFAEDGTLCGSILTMDVAVRNLMQFADLPLHTAVAMATSVPACALGIGKRKGSLEVGKDADIIICDHNVKIRRVFAGGHEVSEHAH